MAFNHPWAIPIYTTWLSISKSHVHVANEIHFIDVALDIIIGLHCINCDSMLFEWKANIALIGQLFLMEDLIGHKD